MTINTLAKLSLIGLIYIYASRLIYTLYHGILRPTAFTGIIVGLNILAGITQFAFFIVLYKYFVTGIGKKLQLAGMLAIVGSAIGLLPKFLAMAVLFQHKSLFFFIGYRSQIGAFCPWLSAFLLLSFSTIFALDPGIRRNIIFKRAFTAGFAGWLIMFTALSLVLINYLYMGQLVWLVDFFQSGLIIFVITSTITFVCLFVFYKSFINADFSTGTILQIKE